MKKYLLIALTAMSVNAFADCKNLQDATQTEISECRNKEITQTKKAIKNLYDQIYEKTSAKTEFEASQKAWLNYRTKQCAFESVIDDSVSMANIINNQNCELHINKQRIEQLDGLSE